ncbi:MAG: protein kinase, partial [Acidobacteriota bacterium]
MSFDSVSRSDPSDFKLGEWWVRVHRRELERPGETVSVEARSFDVLVCLARHAPAVVPKQRLLEEVWTDSPYVGDDVISHAIWDLRRALGDSAKQPDYIQTVPRKGYRLVAEVLRPQGAALPVEGVRIGHYDLGSELGRGSMGVVFGATDRRLGRRVAVKFLAPELTRDPKACRRFEREARLAASLDHPNLGTVHEVGETTQGYKYLVSAFYGGGSLKDLLAAGPPPLEEAVRLVRQLVAGLGAAHRRDIVHRDIKPANLLLDEHGTLKICDFGIAKLLGGTDLTQTGSTLGTPAYKSPEQALGHGVDHRTDLWSVGVVCFELLTGRRPFEGDFEQAVVQSILSEQPRDLEDPERRPIPDDLKSFVLKALAKDPAERFQTAEEMGLALDALGQREAPEVSGPRKKWGRGVAALLGVFLLGAVAMLGRSSLDRPESALPSALASSKEAAVRPVERILIDARRTWIRQGSDSLTLESVRRELDRAREIAPESSDVHAYLAIFHASRYAVGWQPEEKAAAESSAGRIGEGDERYPTALAALAWVAWTDGSSLDQALDWAEESVRLEPLCGEDGLCDFHYYVLGSLQIRMD